MSSKRQATGEDYPDAMVKHCEDARHLLNSRRADGAGYLAGYAVECALKTLVQVERSHSLRVSGHDLTGLKAQALSLAAQPTNRTFRYFTNPGLTSLAYGNPPTGWRETLRYCPAGTVPPATAEQWVDEAERLYIEIIGEMKKNGEV